jgi:hypothetical protein
VRFNFLDTVYRRNWTRSSGQEPRWLGPCTVVKISKSGNLYLLDEKGSQRMNAINPVDVRLYKSHVPHAAIDADVQYVMKERLITNEDGTKRKELQVLWKSTGDETWVPEKDFQDPTKLERWTSEKEKAANQAQAMAQTAADLISSQDLYISEEESEEEATENAEWTDNELDISNDEEDGDVMDDEEDDDIQIQATPEEEELQQKKEKKDKTKEGSCQFGKCLGEKPPKRLWLTLVREHKVTVYMCATCTKDPLTSYLKVNQEVETPELTQREMVQGMELNLRGRKTGNWQAAAAAVSDPVRQMRKRYQSLTKTPNGR